MQRLGIVDLGSNTARLVVFAFVPGRWFRLVDEIREPVRLGEGMGRSSDLSGPAIARALAALRLFADYGAATGLESIEVFATSAVRDARNRQEFLERVKPLGLPVSVLRGETEARLSVLAVANGFDLADAWVIDVGGGSAQISHMEARRFSSGSSHPLGAVRLTEACLASDPPGTEEVESLEERLEEHLGELVATMRADTHPIVAMGGSVRNLANAVRTRAKHPLEILHAYWLPRQNLEELTEELLAKTAAERAEVRGINADRADVILAAALLYRWLLRSAGREGLLISGHGVREGLLFRHFLASPHLLTDVRRFSVENLAQQYPQPAPHVARVRRFARILFDGLRPLHQLGHREAELLDAAAVLHDIGMAISYHHHHKQGAYLVRSAPLDGFDHREQALISLLVRHHRKSYPKLGRFRRIARRGDQKLLLRLAVCLRLAEQLERSRAGRIRDLQVRVDGREVGLLLEASEPPVMELWEARKQAELFRRAFNRKLEVRAVAEVETRMEAPGRT